MKYKGLTTQYEGGSSLYFTEGMNYIVVEPAVDGMLTAVCDMGFEMTVSEDCFNTNDILQFHYIPPAGGSKVYNVDKRFNADKLRKLDSNRPFFMGEVYILTLKPLAFIPPEINYACHVEFRRLGSGKGETYHRVCAIGMDDYHQLIKTEEQQEGRFILEDSLLSNLNKTEESNLVQVETPSGGFVTMEIPYQEQEVRTGYVRVFNEARPEIAYWEEVNGVRQPVLYSSYNSAVADVLKHHVEHMCEIRTDFEEGFLSAEEALDKMQGIDEMVLIAKIEEGIVEITDDGGNHILTYHVGADEYTW